nr:hypothetical protein [Tanacetum cinerariifolium]
MSSPNHFTSNIEDTFSLNFPDYLPASPDYVPASPGKTYSSSSNSFGIVPIASPSLSLFHDDPYMKELLSPKKQGHDQSSSSTYTLPRAFEIGESSRKTSLERHKEQIEGILNHLDEISLDHIKHIKDKIEGLGQCQVAGANNDLTVLNNSLLFDDLLDEKGYYLADGIYPTWTTFVKSFFADRDVKNAVFKWRQDSAQKDVERAFGVL